MLVMKIQFIKSATPFNYGYLPGEYLECNKALGKEFIELGVAIELDDDSNNLPDNLPAKDVFLKAGIMSMQELNEIATKEKLIAINGIGKKLAEQILNFLNK